MKKLKTKNILRIALVSLLALFLMGMASMAIYAAYTHSLHAQRTVAPYGVGIKFSSNYLLKGEAKNNINTIYITDASVSGTNPATIVTICNYTQGKQTEPNPSDIDYELTARLVKKVNGVYVSAANTDFLTSDDFITIKLGENSYTFNKNNPSITTTFNSTLTGRRANADVYELILSKSFATYASIA